jgi:hypothetical protein
VAPDLRRGDVIENIGLHTVIPAQAGIHASLGKRSGGIDANEPRFLILIFTERHF